MTKSKRLISLGLIFTLLLCMTLLPATAARRGWELTTKRIWDKRVESYPSVPVTVNGKPLSEPALLMNDTTYITLRSFSDLLVNAEITYSRIARSATIQANGLTLVAVDGGHVITANDRPLFTMTPTVIMNNGKMYVPIRPMAKAYGVNVLWNDASRSVRVSGAVRFLSSADAYYNADDLYWLSRIISAESRGEPLLGQIAVGTVVLNRKRSSQYPNTIYGVIFDKKYGVQFSPTLDGSVYKAPHYTSVMAAKICLEGFTLGDEVLFFLEPRISTSSWIIENRRYAFSIGNHDFYY